MTTTTREWLQSITTPAGSVVVRDGVETYDRPLADGETVAEAAADFAATYSFTGLDGRDATEAEYAAARAALLARLDVSVAAS